MWKSCVYSTCILGRFSTVWFWCIIIIVQKISSHGTPEFQWDSPLRISSEGQGIILYLDNGMEGFARCGCSHNRIQIWHVVLLQRDLTRHWKHSFSQESYPDSICLPCRTISARSLLQWSFGWILDYVLLDVKQPSTNKYSVCRPIMAGTLNIKGRPSTFKSMVHIAISPSIFPRNS